MNIMSIFHFPLVLSVITLQINLKRIFQYILLMTIIRFNRTVAENYFKKIM